MPSIRLSLVLYFLGLLSVALGVASLLVYRSAQNTLRDKEEATAQLIENTYQTRCQSERDRLDAALLTQAKAIARRVRVQVDLRRAVGREMHVLGAWTASMVPNGFALMPLWVAEGIHSPHQPVGKQPAVGFEIYRRNLAELKLPENELMLDSEGLAGEYYQIDSNYWGRPLRSESLEGRWLPDTYRFAPDALVDYEAIPFELEPGRKVRLVRLKVASARKVSIWTDWKPPPRTGPATSGTAANRTGSRKGRTPFPNKPSPPRPHEPPPLAIYVQCAADMAQLDASLARLRASRDDDLAQLGDQTAAALARLRNQLWAIASVTFAATVLGAFWLVWRGLSPLRRLGDAVSKISPRDFRLPLEGDLPTELRPIVERLTGTLELLKRAFSREKQSTADISHELRTPLAALLTTIDLALRKPRTGEQYREMLQECRASALQVNQIVERLLTLARLDAGVDRLRPQQVDVIELAEQCATVVRPLAEARGLQLAVHAQSPPPDTTEGAAAKLTTDPDKLREVLNNLLHNAIQYNTPEGRIDLTVGRNNGHVRLEVRDTGIGITPEAREHIFERFYRADPSRNGDGLHAGLGLAIVKEYVELMGGQISVESMAGQGSTFRVELPVWAEGA